MRNLLIIFMVLWCSASYAGYKVTGNLEVTSLAGAGDQCVRANNGGVLVGTGSDCGSGTGTGITGLTAGKVPKAATPTSIADSAIYEHNDLVGIGSTSPRVSLDVSGDIYSTGFNSNLNFTTTGHYTGFPNRTDTTLAFVAGASGVTRTLTISGTNWKVWINGVQYNVPTTLTNQIDDVTGMYWFWITNTAGTITLNSSVNAPGFDKALVATVYWNTTTDAGIISDERHWMGRDQWMHEYLHETVGARYYTGLTGTFTNTTFAITAGEFYDEDIEHSLSSDTPMAYPGTAITVDKVLYHNGTAEWQWQDNSTTVYLAIAGVLQFNNGNTLTPVTNNRYVNYWVFATNSSLRPIHTLIGTAEYTTLALARAATVPSFGGLESAEMKLIYKVTYQNSGGSPAYQEATDYRATSSIPSAGFVPTNHATLSNLAFSTSGHTWDAELNTGAQNIITTGSLGVGSTSPQAKLDVEGNVYFGNGNIGVGTVSPQALFAISSADATRTNKQVYIDNSVYSTAFTISNTGNVGIGTTAAPIWNLCVGTTCSFGVSSAGMIKRIENTEGASLGSSGLLLAATTSYIRNNSGQAASVLELLGGSGASSSVNIKATSSTSNTGDYVKISVGNNGGTEALRVIDSGNIGIGTTSPSSLLEVGAQKVNILSGGNLGVGDTTPDFGLEVAVPSSFAVSSTASGDGDRFVVTSGGNVGIGTVSPSRAFDVFGKFWIDSSGNITKIGNSASNAWSGGTMNMVAPSVINSNSASGSLNLQVNGNSGIFITTALNVGIGTTAPLSKLGVFGNVAIGTTYAGLAAPTDGVMVSGSVGIGSTAPQQKLDVAGTIQSTGLKMTTSPSAGYVLTSDSVGLGTWQPAPTTTGSSEFYVVVDGSPYGRTSTGITTALTAVASGGEVFLTKGAYDMTAKVTVSQDNVTITCERGAILTAAAAVNDSMFTVTGDNVTFQGACVLDGNKANQTTIANEYSNVCLNSYQAPSLKVDGITVQNCHNHGIRLSYDANVVISNVTCIDVGKTGLAGNIYGNCVNIGESPNLKIFNLKSSGSLGSGIFFYSAGDDTVNTPFLIDGADISGVVTDQDSGIEINNSNTSITIAANGTIVNSYFHDMTETEHGVNGVLVYGDNMLLSNNRADVTGVCYEISSGSKNPTAIGNKCTHATGTPGSDAHAFYASATNGLFVDNTIYEYAGHGFDVIGKNNTFLNNSITNPTSSGNHTCFFLEGANDNTKIVNNKCIDDQSSAKLQYAMQAQGTQSTGLSYFGNTSSGFTLGEFAADTAPTLTRAQFISGAYFNTGWNGNVGIGTAAPQFALDVGGEIRVSGVTGSGKAVCVKSDGAFGNCTDTVGASGTCTCN